MNDFLPVCEPMLAGNELKYVTDAISTGWISSAGSYVSAFERAFADYCGVRHGIAVCNGTVALHLALRALGIGPGDEVIIPDFTMIASALAVCYCGEKPVFVDADAATWNMDVSAVERDITPATKGIMAVHIFGNPCEMTALQRIADRHGLWLMEDAAEAHGAIYHGKKTGALSRIAAFSFFANISPMVRPPLPYCLAMVMTTLFISITIPFCLCCFHPQRLKSRVIHPDMPS